MEREVVFRIALVGTLIGLLILFIVSDMMKPEAKKVCGVDESMNGKKVSVAGFVRDIRDLSNGGTSFTLFDGGCGVKVVYFGDDLVLDNKEGAVAVVGMTQIYRGEIELIADQVLGLKDARRSLMEEGNGNNTT